MLPPLLSPPRVVPTSAVAWAVDRLAAVDYTVANRVTDGVATAVHFVYAHHLPPRLVPLLLHALQFFDDLGSLLILAAVWLAEHSVPP